MSTDEQEAATSGHITVPSPPLIARQQLRKRNRKLRARIDKRKGTFGSPMIRPSATKLELAEKQQAVHCGGIGLLGKSLRPLAESTNIDHWRDYIVTENHTGRMLRSVDFKYCVYREGDLRESLVNMREDPGEMKNLATAPEHANTLNEHRRYLKQWITLSGDQDAESFALAPDPRVTN